jgi:hypothetical protein
VEKEEAAAAIHVSLDVARHGEARPAKRTATARAASLVDARSGNAPNGEGVRCISIARRTPATFYGVLVGRRGELTRERPKASTPSNRRGLKATMVSPGLTWDR